MKAHSLIVWLYCSLCFANIQEDLAVRAARSIFIPSVNFRYSYNNQHDHHFFWLNLEWQFDDIASSQLVAVEIARLKSEERLLSREMAILDADLLPTSD